MGDQAGSNISLAERSEIEARIARKKAGLEALTNELASYQVDCDNLIKSIAKDEEILKGLQ